MPKYGGAAAFTTAAFFQELWLFCGIISAIAACMAVIALRRKDRTEFFGTGQAQKIGFKDYVDVISHNRAIQMLVVNASTDKLASSMMSGSVIMVMLYGIICGNYAQYGLMSAATSIPYPRCGGRHAGDPSSGFPRGAHRFLEHRWKLGVFYLLVGWTGLGLAFALVDLLIALPIPKDENGMIEI